MQKEVAQDCIFNFTIFCWKYFTFSNCITKTEVVTDLLNIIPPWIIVVCVYTSPIVGQRLPPYDNSINRYLYLTAAQYTLYIDTFACLYICFYIPTFGIWLLAQRACTRNHIEIYVNVALVFFLLVFAALSAMNYVLTYCEHIDIYIPYTSGTYKFSLISNMFFVFIKDFKRSFNRKYYDKFK